MSFAAKLPNPTVHYLCGRCRCNIERGDPESVARVLLQHFQAKKRNEIEAVEFFIGDEMYVITKDDPLPTLQPDVPLGRKSAFVIATMRTFLVPILSYLIMRQVL